MRRSDTPMKRSAPKPRKSARLAAYESEFREARVEVRKRSLGRCEASTEACTVTAVHVHHRKLRSHGGSNDPSNLLDLCTPCHEWIHAHPAVSYERGWMVRAAERG